MAYTLSDIVTKVQQRIRDTGYSSSEITNYINDAQNDIFNEYRLPFMQTEQDYTLTPGVADITNGVGLPTNYVQAVDLVMTSSGAQSALTYIDFAELDRMYPDSEDTTAYPVNIPTMWYFYGDTIKVFPTPASAQTLTLRYYKKPTELSADTDVPEVPSEFREILVMGAAYRVMQVKDNYDQAGVMQNKYDEILQKLVVKYSMPQVGTAMRQKINRYARGKRYY
jgi:hypothetical protein